MTTTVTITDEMPDAWVADVVTEIERRRWTVRDAHESAVVVTITPTAAAVLGTDEDDVLVIGWTERHGVDWGISSDGGTTVDTATTFTEDADPAAIGEAVDRLMLAGRPDARLVHHGLPRTAPSASCRCETARPCGALVVSTHCEDHRDARMLWHWEGNACNLTAAARN